MIDAEMIVWLIWFAVALCVGVLNARARAHCRATRHRQLEELVAAAARARRQRERSEPFADRIAEHRASAELEHR
jgi:hypothetical protein